MWCWWTYGPDGRGTILNCKSLQMWTAHNSKALPNKKNPISCAYNQKIKVFHVHLISWIHSATCIGKQCENLYDSSYELPYYNWVTTKLHVQSKSQNLKFDINIVRVQYMLKICSIYSYNKFFGTISPFKCSKIVK